ncbi:MAG: tetratricopeptide repeat protein [Phycisphaerae bacterium]|nr:tetratricopeptide repeat protein [Phycisphaerae bacterium]
MKSFSRIVSAVVGLSFAACLGGCMPDLRAEQSRMRGYDALTRREDPQAALAWFKTAADQDPANPKAHYYIGRITLDTGGDPAFARRHLEIAHTLSLKDRLNSTSPYPGTRAAVPTASLDQIADALGEAHFREKNPHRLIAFLDQQVEEEGSVEAYMRRGFYLHKVGDNDNARLSYQEAARLSGGTSARPYVALADFYDSVGDREQALTNLRVAYGINPDHPRLANRIRAHGTVPGPTVALPVPE